MKLGGGEYTNGLKVENYGRDEGLMRYKTYLHRTGQREGRKKRDTDQRYTTHRAYIHLKDSSPSHTNPPVKARK